MATDWHDIREGDDVVRMLCGTIPMKLNVSSVDENYIHCGPWKFLRTNGMEVDETLGWDGQNITGSHLRRVAPDV